MSDFSQYMNKIEDLRKHKEFKEKEASKKRLMDLTKKRVKTTMIGAIASIESHLGHLWDKEFMTDKEIRMKKVFDELRSDILDKGNNQVRQLENDFNSYDITWKRYTMKLPFVNKEDGNV